MGTKQDFVAIEEWRVGGLQLLKRKVSQSEVARQLAVTLPQLAGSSKQEIAGNGRFL